MDEEPYYQCQELFEWNLKKLEQATVSIDDLDCLNLFDLGDIDPLISEIEPLINNIEPFASDNEQLTNESFINSQDEMSFENLFSDIVDINAIIDQNDSFSKNQKEEGNRKENESMPLRKMVKRLDDQKIKNKEAVIKYRSKKNQKREELFRECEIFSKKNSELRMKCEDLQTEISLIKSLLVEALLAKNK